MSEGLTAEPKDGDVIAVWFSSGVPSAVAAKLAVDRYAKRCDVRVVNNFVLEEDSDNRRFLRDVERWIGVEIEDARNVKFPHASAAKVWDARGGMSFPHGAPCTQHLKKEARQQWEARNLPDWHVLGFGYEEKVRHDRFVLTERPNVLPLLIVAQLTRQDCYEMIVEAGIEPPRIYAMGYPNANCIGCVKATSPTYWNHVRQVHPDVFEARAEQSRRLGAKLVRVNNKRIFLDELDPTTVGRPMAQLKAPECGLFCETQTAYFAHPITDYGTERETAAIKIIREAGYGVENPNKPRHQSGYASRGMDYFLDIVRRCDALAFMPFPDGFVGAGVAKEIDAARMRGIPVFEVDDDGLIDPGELGGRILSVDETRLRVRPRLTGETQ